MDKIGRFRGYEGQPAVGGDQNTLRLFSGIEFGDVTYESDFFELLDQKQFLTKENRLLKENWFQGEYRMIVASPK